MITLRKLGICLVCIFICLVNGFPAEREARVVAKRRVPDGAALDRAERETREAVAAAAEAFA